MKPVEILNPSSWKRYSPSMCHSCWAGCCTLPVLVSPEDLYHMGYLRAEQVNGPLATHVTRLKRAGVVQSFNARTQIFTLAQKNGTDCTFLNSDRRCTIYDRRPSVCRKFPENAVRPGYCPNQPK